MRWYSTYIGALSNRFCSASSRGSPNQRNLNEISRLEVDLETRIHNFRPPDRIHFVFPPGPDTPDLPISPSDDPNDLSPPPLILRDHPENHSIIEFESWITEILGRLSKFIDCKDAPVQAAASTLRSQLELQAQGLYNLIRQEWQRQKENSQFQARVATFKKPTESSAYDCCKCLQVVLRPVLIMRFQRKFVPATPP